MWPVSHDWSASYKVTYSFATTILPTYSGLEQRIATRVEPRRTLTTQIAEWDDVRLLDRFLWSTQASAFPYTDPVSGAVSVVRLADTQEVDHPSGGTSVASFTLTVEPSTDAYDEAQVSANSYAGRYVLPFTQNWSQGTPDSFSFPRRTIDYGRGRIAVDRPVAFATRASTLTLLRVGADETTALSDFFRYMRGRQGDFWIPGFLDDMAVVETVSNVVTVSGIDVAAMYAADGVNCGVRVELMTGGVYYRTITAATVSATNTTLTLNTDFPDKVNTKTVRRCCWLRVGRFSSDDLTIEWLTGLVAQSQIQVQTLPYAVAEGALGMDEMQDYYGTALDRSFSLRDYTINRQIPNLDNDPGNTAIERPEGV